MMFSVRLRLMLKIKLRLLRKIVYLLSLLFNIHINMLFSSQLSHRPRSKFNNRLQNNRLSSDTPSNSFYNKLNSRPRMVFRF